MQYKAKAQIRLRSVSLCLVVFCSLCLVQSLAAYNKQVLAILENKPDLIEAAQFLHTKNPGSTDAVMWDPERSNFYRYDLNTKSMSDNIVEKAYAGLKQRIQVVGHGQEGKVAATNKHTVTMSGFTGEELGTVVSKLVKDPKTPGGKMDIGRISLAGCKLAPDEKNPNPWNEAKEGFLRSFCETLDGHEVSSTVTARTTLVGVSPTGQKLFGALRRGDIKWVSKIGREPFYKVKTDTEEFKLKPVHLKPRKNVALGEEEGQDMQRGIMSGEDGAYISFVEPNLKVTKAVQVQKSVIQNLLEESASQIYNHELTTGPKDTTDTETVMVRRRDPETKREMYKALKVRKITGNDPKVFMTELKRRAEKFQSGDTSDRPRPGESEPLYYRYGDWIFSMKKSNLYVNVEGVVAVEDAPLRQSGIKVPTDGYTPLDKTQTESMKLLLKKSLINEEVPLESVNVPEEYPAMRRKITDNFLENAKKWMYGSEKIAMPSRTSKPEEFSRQAHDGQMALAMFMAEPIRNFRTHLTNVMGLDLAGRPGFLSRDQFIDSHPMARGLTWTEEIVDANGKSRKPAGMEQAEGPNTDGVKARMTAVTQTWLARMKAYGNDVGRFVKGGTKTLLGSLRKPGWNKVDIEKIENQQHEMFGSFVQNLKERITSSGAEPLNLPGSGEFTRTYSELISDLPVTEKDVVATSNGVELDHEFSDEIAPPTFSSYLAIDQNLINNKIAAELEKVRVQYPQHEVEIDLKSIKTSGSEVSFDVVWDKSAYPPNTGKVQKTVTVNEDELLSKRKLEDFHERTQALSSRGVLTEVNKGLSIYGTVMGLKASITELKKGDIPHGMIGLTQSLHGIGELTGINRKVYSVGKKLLGKVLDSGVRSLESTVLSGVSSEIRAGASVMGELLEDVPIVGTAFGIYNIVQDFQKGTVLGYIDADLDIAITALSFLGPEADIVTVPLTIIRMAIDELFGNIHINTSLPIDAQIRQFFEQFGRNFINFAETFTPIGAAVKAVEEVKKLEAEYKKEQEYLKKLEDSQEFYKIVNSGTTIDFASGMESQYGGSIVFKMGEKGSPSSFSYIAAVVDGKPQEVSTQTTLSQSVKDLVLGLGESLKITTTEKSVQFHFIIDWGSVDKRRVFSKVIKDKKSLNGEYHGNSEDNTFYCVQNHPDGLPFNLDEYFYGLYGHDGDDKFMLGPQHAYVEGGSGSDTLFIHEKGAVISINNYALDSSTDYINFYAKFDELEFHRENHDLVIYIKSQSSLSSPLFGTSHSDAKLNGVTHVIRLQNWYLDETYQHMHFTSSDSVTFRMTVNKHGDPQAAVIALNLINRATGQTVKNHPYCSFVVGSKFSDTIHGSQISNHIEGGTGDDTIMGMDGKDMYVIREHDGVDILDNSATDNEIDTLFLLVSHTELVATVSGDDLLIRSHFGPTGVRISKWFSGDQKYRHLQLVDMYGVVLKIPTDKTDLKLVALYLDTSLTSITPDLTQPDLQDIRDVKLTTPATVTCNSLDNMIYAPTGSSEIYGNYGSNTYILGENTLPTIVTSEDSPQLIVVDIDGKFKLEYGNNGVEILTSPPTNTYPRKYPETIAYLDAKHRMTQNLFPITQIRSHGIMFRLEYIDYNNLKVIPIMVDLSHGDMQKTWPLDSSNFRTNEFFDIDMTLTDAHRVIGPPSNVNIKCSYNGNYVDPGKGGSLIVGGEGSDTFVYKPDYGTKNTVKTYVSKADTVLFRVPYDDIKFLATDQQSYVSVTLSSISSDLQVEFQITKQNPPYRLLVISSNGVTAELRGENQYNILAPISINRANADGQTVDLSSSEMWDTVISVHGSTLHSNHLTGNSNNNTLVGGSLSDTLYGMEGDDTLKGGAGDNHMYGGWGNDLLVGGTGNDYMYGNDDQDTFIIPVSSKKRDPQLNIVQRHYVDGGEGSDTVVCVSKKGCRSTFYDWGLANTFNLITGQVDDVKEYTYSINVENIIGSPYNDNLEGNELDNTLSGLDGDDTLNPNKGADSLIGGEGSDTYVLKAGHSGFVAINNFAKDGKKDTIRIEFDENQQLKIEMCDKQRWKDLLNIEQVSQSLIIRWLSITDPIFYDDFHAPRISVHNWFSGDDYKHLCLTFCDNIFLCDDVLTSPTYEEHPVVVF